MRGCDALAAITARRRTFHWPRTSSWSPIGRHRSSGATCCSNFCGANGLCSQQSFCASAGATCTSGTECCTRTCGVTSCLTIPGSPNCGVTGAACISNSQCCSTNCQGGTCAPAYSCQANGDVCGKNTDCCGLACSITDGGAGYCQNVTGGGGGGCTQDGNPCSSGPSVGQTCSETNPCCPGSTCLDFSTFSACGPTGNCSCVISD